MLDFKKILSLLSSCISRRIKRLSITTRGNFLERSYSDFSQGKNSYAKIDQLRFLSQSVLLEEAAPPRTARFLLMVISLIILVFVVWAGFTTVNEIAATEGEVLPSKYIQSVQHLEGGIVAKIDVSEGELVEKDQVLIKLDGAGLKKDLASLEAKALNLEYQSISLKAFINQTTPNFNEMRENAKQETADEQLRAFYSMIKAKESEKDIIEEQITQKEQSLEVLQKKIETLSENFQLVIEERDLKKQLMEKGNISKVNFLEIQKQFNDLEGEIEQTDSEISQAQNAIDEYKNRLNSLNAKFVDEAYKQLQQVNTDLAQTNEAIHKLSDQIERLDIRSPVYGYAKGLKVKTIGGVVEGGKTLLEVVPLEGALVIETKISPRDVGHISIGQPVRIKISSYDFTRYGTVQGKLEYVSATTFVNDDGTKYYLGKISMEKNYVGKDQSLNLIIPGMTVEADIVTGKKSVLSYLLKPVHSSLTTAFTER